MKVNFAGAPPRQALAGSVVEGVVRLPDLLVGDVVEAPPLREPVPQEPVGVLVGAPLLRLVGVAEADGRAQALLQARAHANSLQRSTVTVRTTIPARAPMVLLFTKK